MLSSKASAVCFSFPSSRSSSNCTLKLPVCAPVLSGRRGRPASWAGMPRDSLKLRLRTLSGPEEQALSASLPLCLQLTGAYRKKPSSPSQRFSWHPWAQLPAVMATGSAFQPWRPGSPSRAKGEGLPVEASLLLGSRSPPTICPLAEATYLPPFCHETPAPPLTICLSSLGQKGQVVSSPQALKRKQDGVGSPGLTIWLGQ